MESTPAKFVIALCALTRPIPIPQPRSSPLNRYRFFLARRSAEGREFFVLHMGHFASAAEAEKWVKVLRGTYPNAYVSDSTEPVEDGVPSPLSDTQVLRVLEVRHPTPDLVLNEEPAAPVAAPVRASAAVPAAALVPAAAQARSAPNLRIKALETLAAQESPTGAYESLTDTGVRHLSIQVEKKRSRLLRRPRTRLR